MPDLELIRLTKMARVIYYREHIEEFLKDFFPHHYNKPFANFHKEIFKILSESPRIAIAAPRKHGKTTVVTFGWVMFNLLLNPHNRFTIIVSNNYNNAVKCLIPIKEELEHNQKLIDLFGNLKSDKWSENEIELTSKKKIVVGGNDFKIRGQKYLQFRPDLILIDDPEDDEMVRSQERRENFEHWILYSLDPALTFDKNQIVYIDTVKHRDSQLVKFMSGEGKYREWFSRKFTAIIDENTPNEQAIWEEAISLEWLRKEREKEPYVFSQEYMNNPVPYEHAMFKSEYFDDYTDEKIPKDLIINITVDLACTDKEYSDYTVILPVGVDYLGDLWVLPYVRGKYVDPDKIVDELLKMVERYQQDSHWKLGKVGIEKVAFQRFLIKNLDKERKKRGLHFPIVELDAKGDKTQRISQLQPWFSAKDIHIRSSMLDLKEELLDFPRARHDDIADTLAMQLEFVNRRPLKHILTDEKWKITPEKQRQKVMRRRFTNLKPKVYVGFAGV